MKTQKAEIVESIFGKDNSLTRRIVLDGADRRTRIEVVETEDDNSTVTVTEINNEATVKLDPEKLWHLIHGVAELFGGTVLTRDQARVTEAQLIDKIRDVLCANEARCLDDDIDREVVLRELVRALS